MNKPQSAQRLSRIIGIIIHFPLIQIIVGVILVNVPTFILRNIAQFILSSLAVKNAAVEAFAIFSVRSLTVYFAIVFRIIEKSLGSWIAIVVASFVFGFKHLLFPGHTFWSVFAQTLEAGLLFTALFISSRKIWLIYGFHVVWNFVQYGFIMGFDAENLTPLFISDFTGSSLITGMPVGLEASIVTFCIGTALGICFLKKAYKKGNFIPPFWKRA